MTIQFRDTYRKTASVEIDLLEQQLGYSLPDQYKRFLLEYNGGGPTPSRIKYQKPDEDRLSSTVVQYFFGIYDQGDTYDLYNNSWSLWDYEGRMPPNFLPIAIDVFGNLFCLSLAGNDVGKVYFWHHESSDFENRTLGVPPGYTDIDLISNSFDEFVSMLYED